MKDLIELAYSIDRKLSEQKQKEEFCDLLLKELHALKGKDLAPYLSECIYDTKEQGVIITLKFPIGSEVLGLITR